MGHEEVGTVSLKPVRVHGNGYVFLSFVCVNILLQIRRMDLLKGCYLKKKKLVGISHYYITLLFSAQLNEIREGIDGSKKGVEGILICRWYDSKPGKSQEDK